MPDLLVITDVCLCQYTSHGHCGVVEDGRVRNDPTLDLLARTAVSQVEAGADLVITYFAKEVVPLLERSRG